MPSRVGERTWAARRRGACDRHAAAPAGRGALPLRVTGPAHPGSTDPRGSGQVFDRGGRPAKGSSASADTTHAPSLRSDLPEQRQEVEVVAELDDLAVVHPKNLHRPNGCLLA